MYFSTEKASLELQRAHCRRPRGLYVSVQKPPCLARYSVSCLDYRNRNLTLPTYRKLDKIKAAPLNSCTVADGIMSPYIRAKPYTCMWCAPSYLVRIPGEGEGGIDS